MTDPIKKLEDELSGMHPAGLSGQLIERIESDLASVGSVRPSPWPDRMLLTSMFAGAIAACIIVGMLLMPEPGSSNDTPAPLASTPPRVGSRDYPIAWASSEARWTELIK